jgi:hypothetical protein
VEKSRIILLEKQVNRLINQELDLPSLPQNPRQTRTYINDVISALDRRKNKKPLLNSSKPINRPKKKIIYDDFGEPIREVWSD